MRRVTRVEALAIGKRFAFMRLAVLTPTDALH
jgi:hypothetical protein